MGIEFSTTAVSDLRIIGAYIEERSGPERADAYETRIRAKIATLLNFPNRGTDRNRVEQGYRSITFEGRPVILYHVGRDVVTIARVVAGKRDLSDVAL
ncbi:MAG TPA: type II toxin-antitoxin system RelE/ParE family toxin [Sphingomonas sp.]|nr:type II toxin-antitoxin system RelE/ParE family toxin [Sphingomonas sp.]